MSVGVNTRSPADRIDCATGSSSAGGINVYRVDPTSGAWSHEQLLEILNPSFLTLDRAQRLLYSVHADLEEVSAYAIDKQNGRITSLNRKSCGGKNPVHLSIDPTGRWIITANYSDGTIGVVPIEKDGNLGPRSDLVNLPGEPGPDRKQQASSHPHNTVFDPSGRFIAVADKGVDRVFIFRLDAANGKLMPNDPPFVATRAGAGPRHIAFHSHMPLAYAVNELERHQTASMRSGAACSRSKSCRRSRRATPAITPAPRSSSRPPAASFTHRTADTTVSRFLLSIGATGP
jgi:6-phosphogluconolactonase